MSTIDNEAVERAWQSDFGKVLFNLYTQDRPERPHLLFSRRLLVVKAMLATMLEQEQVQQDHVGKSLP